MQKDYSMKKAIHSKIKIPPIAYQYTGQEDLLIKKDIVYKTIGDCNYTFDIYYPKNFIAEETPLVLFINGGGPIKMNYKDYACYTSWGELVALNNIIGITFNWESGKYNQIEDMLNYLFDHEKELNISVNKICVFPLCRAVKSSINIILNYPTIKDIILYYGKIDKNINISKINNMHFLMAMGAKDTKYPPNCNDWFIEKLKDTSNSIEILIHPNGEHGFDYINHDNDTKEIIEKTLLFMKKK